MLILSLTLVFLAFCALMAGVLAFCFRERRRAQANARSDDNFIAKVMVGVILAGAALALITGYLVFMRDWG